MRLKIAIMLATNPPLFSVIIPTYNRAAKVIRAIDSVLAQTSTDFDLWIIDDGSTDQTASALAPYLNRLHYIQIPNGGLSNARNLGIQQSTGRYVAFLDSDDRWFPKKLEYFAGAIKQHPRTGLFYSRSEFVDEEGHRLWIDSSRSMEQNSYRTLLKGNFINVTSAVVRRECFDQVGLFDPTLRSCEDWDLWLRLAQKFPVCLVPNILASYEYASSDKMTSKTTIYLDAHDQVIEKAFQRDPNLNEAVRQEIQAHQAYIKGRVYLEARKRRGRSPMVQPVDFITTDALESASFPFHSIDSQGAPGATPVCFSTFEIAGNSA